LFLNGVCPYNYITDVPPFVPLLPDLITEYQMTAAWLYSMKRRQWMSLTILMVDDDKLLVKKLEETVNWKHLDISMVFTAHDIHTAQALLSEYPINILLCDIDMPKGSGLELLEWVRETKLEVECVFLSSYANFAYAQKALTLASKDYLLKPISNGDIEKSLGMIVDTIRQKKNSYDICDEPSAMQAFWQAYVFDSEAREEMLADICQRGIYTPDDRFRLVIIKAFPEYDLESKKKNLSLFNYSSGTLTQSFLEKRSISLDASIHLEDFERQLVFQVNDKNAELKQVLTELRSYYCTVFPYPCCIFEGALTLLAQVDTAQKVIEHIARHIIPDDDGMVFQEQLPAKQADDSPPPWDAWYKEMLLAADLCTVAEQLRFFIDNQASQAVWTSKLIVQFVQGFVQMLYSFLKERGIRFGNLFDNETFASLEQYAHTSLKGLRNFVSYVFEILAGNQNRKENVVEHLQGYIEDHLGEDLSRKSLAQKAYLSEVYLSKQFVKIIGMSIPAYVASRRIKKAKYFLEHSSLPVSKIAIEVGYNNLSYFSKSFRDITGCTPNEYRNATRKINGITGTQQNIQK